MKYPYGRVSIQIGDLVSEVFFTARELQEISEDRRGLLLLNHASRAASAMDLSDSALGFLPRQSVPVLGTLRRQEDAAARCRKCGGGMHPGVALQSTLKAGMPDFPGDAVGDVCTMSEGGPGKLVSCLKCRDCGYSTIL